MDKNWNLEGLSYHLGSVSPTYCAHEACTNSSIRRAKAQALNSRSSWQSSKSKTKGSTDGDLFTLGAQRPVEKRTECHSYGLLHYQIPLEDKTMVTYSVISIIFPLKPYHRSLKKVSNTSICFCLFYSLIKIKTTGVLTKPKPDSR